jgi:hypothetical protein
MFMMISAPSTSDETVYFEYNHFMHQSLHITNKKISEF